MAGLRNHFALHLMRGMIFVPEYGISHAQDQDALVALLVFHDVAHGHPPHSQSRSQSHSLGPVVTFDPAVHIQVYQRGTTWVVSRQHLILHWLAVIQGWPLQWGWVVWWATARKLWRFWLRSFIFICLCTRLYYCYWIILWIWKNLTHRTLNAPERCQCCRMAPYPVDTVFPRDL